GGGWRRGCGCHRREWSCGLLRGLQRQGIGAGGGERGMDQPGVDLSHPTWCRRARRWWAMAREPAVVRWPGRSEERRVGKEGSGGGRPAEDRRNKELEQES